MTRLLGRGRTGQRLPSHFGSVGTRPGDELDLVTVDDQAIFRVFLQMYKSLR
jgi:hypothetical protein